MTSEERRLYQKKYYKENKNRIKKRENIRYQNNIDQTKKRRKKSKEKNRGKYNGTFNFGWDIDHMIPVSTAKTEEDVIRLNHYTNLQPLCSKINRDIKRNLS
jgi:cytidylate kinase